MINVTVLRLSIVFGAITALSGCVSFPWPDLPPEEYTGTVINAPLNRAEPGATVYAFRSPRGLVIAPDELIGSTTTGWDGTFRLRTRTGYASHFTVGSADHRLSGGAPVRSQRNNIILRLEPNVGPNLYRGVSSETDIAKAAEAAIRSIAYDISRQPTRAPESLRDYARRGVITEQQLSVFTAHPTLFFGSSPLIEFRWAGRAFLFTGADAPLSFRRATRI